MDDELGDVLGDVLMEVLAGGAPRAAADVASWWPAQRAVMAAAGSPFEAAARGGARADRLGWAFAAGYEAALWALWPARDRAVPAALCATEPGGLHPRALATELRDGALFGEKTFVTLGSHAEELLVLARAGEAAEGAEREAGRVPLVLASVAADAEGVALEALGPTPFVPEIPHAAVRFDGAAATVLPGDGWADHVRPFRTVEDVHVHAAFVAWLTASGRRFRWPEALAERGAALLLALCALSAADPSAPATHLALAGVIAQTRALVEAAEPRWADAPEEDARRWRRDRPLLDVAGKARAKRRAKAWARLCADAPRR